MVLALTSPLTCVKDVAKYITSAYSFDLGKGEAKLVTTLTSPLTRVKDEVKCVNALIFL